jgi:hypothetical protein
LPEAADGLAIRRGELVAFARDGKKAAALSGGSGDFPLVSLASTVCDASESEGDGALHYGASGSFSVVDGLRFGPRDLVASAPANGALHAFGVVEGAVILTLDCQAGRVEKHDLPTHSTA